MNTIIPPVDLDDWPDDYDECPVCMGLSWHIPTRRCTNGCDDDDVSALVFVLVNMGGIPDVWAPARPGELWEDVLARKDAAEHMVDELLVEFAAAGEVAA